MTIESRRICSGYVNPPTPEAALEQHLLVLDLIPYMLSVSPLDCEALDLMYGFDFVYRGNHDALIAEALGFTPALESLLNIPGAQPLNFEPSITMTLDEACRLQARLMVETRTNAFHVRRREFPEEPISVFFTVRQYGSLPVQSSFKTAMEGIAEKAEELMEAHVVEQILKPLQLAISAK